jgi:hypothetical protein
VTTADVIVAAMAGETAMAAAVFMAANGLAYLGIMLGGHNKLGDATFSKMAHCMKVFRMQLLA